jgi:phenylalanyl-tRNA synthetase beta chain
MSQVKLQVEIKDPKLCPRYQAVVMELPKHQPNNYLLPMQTFIARSGMRSIDRVVDITNELMLLTGQPLHAFDHDKLIQVGGLDTAKIIVRAAKKGEKLELLDGKTIEMAEGDIVITSNDVPVALAGAMGGANTAIDGDTKRIVLESATFNLYNLRTTQFRHGIFSEAITRFTKGQPPALTEPVIEKAIEVYANYCGAQAISEVADAYPKRADNQPVKVSAKQVNELLGTDYSYEAIETTLKNVGFEVACDCGKADKCNCEFINVTAPYWRTDIHIPEDVIEEVGRLNGYDNIPARLPERNYHAVTPDALCNLNSNIRATLSAAGANEVLTYSFVSEKLLEKSGQDPKNSYKIINSISPELQYVRQGLVPSLLEKIYENQKNGFKNFALFELNQVFIKDEGLTKEEVPGQFDDLALVIADGNYYLAKKYAEDLAASLGIALEFKPAQLMSDELYFEPKRSAEIHIDNERAGVVGEVKGSVLKNFKLEKASAVMLNLNGISKEALGQKPYRQGSGYPSVERDLTFRASDDLEYAKLENFICQTLAGQDLWFQLEPLSIYQGEDKKVKNISFRLNFASYDKTLAGEEIAAIIDNIVVVAENKLKAKVI